MHIYAIHIYVDINSHLYMIYIYIIHDIHTYNAHGTIHYK